MDRFKIKCDQMLDMKTGKLASEYENFLEKQCDEEISGYLNNEKNNKYLEQIKNKIKRTADFQEKMAELAGFYLFLSEKKNDIEKIENNPILKFALPSNLLLNTFSKVKNIISKKEIDFSEIFFNKEQSIKFFHCIEYFANADFLQNKKNNDNLDSLKDLKKQMNINFLKDNSFQKINSVKSCFNAVEKVTDSLFKKSLTISNKIYEPKIFNKMINIINSVASRMLEE